MIIEFTTRIEALYYTAEEHKREEELQNRLNEINTLTAQEHKEDYDLFLLEYRKEGTTVAVEKWQEDYLEELGKIYEERKRLWETLCKRVKKKRGNEGLLKDVKEITDAYTLEDFTAYTKKIKNIIETSRLNASLKANLFDFSEEEMLAILKEHSEENFKNCFEHLYSYTGLSNAVELLDEEYKLTALEIIKARVALWYERPIEGVLGERTATSTNLPILHGRATDAIAKMAGKSSLLSVDNISHTGTYSTGKGEKQVIGTLKNFDKLAGALGISTHKLLMAGIAVFTDRNHTGESSREIKDTSVAIPLKVYASKCGYDVEVHKKRTPEEAKKEAERAKSALKNARRKIAKDLILLYNFSLKYKDNVKGKETDFGERRLIDSYDIRGGYIYFNFAKEFSDYLIQLPLSQYSEALLSIDERSPNAYKIGIQLSNHFNNDNNIGKGTAQLLRVKTILSYTDLPTIDVVRAQNKSWVERIKEPLETALDTLTTCGYLKDWEYTHSKGAPLTEEEAKALINDFEKWADTLVLFTPKNATDHTARIEAKAQRIAEAEAKKAKKPTKSKKPAKGRE